MHFTSIGLGLYMYMCRLRTGLMTNRCPHYRHFNNTVTENDKTVLCYIGKLIHIMTVFFVITMQTDYSMLKLFRQILQLYHTTLYMQYGLYCFGCFSLLTKKTPATLVIEINLGIVSQNVRQCVST